MSTFSCTDTHNVWKVSGTVADYSSQPVYISIRGELDSTYTDTEGKFMFSYINQYSDFVRVSLYRNMSSSLHMFVDSVSHVEIHINDTAHMQYADVRNSPETQALQELYRWHEQRKKIVDSVLYAYKKERAAVENYDSLRIVYISQLDQFHDDNVAYLDSFINQHKHSPVATTASFMTFDTVSFKPLLMHEPNFIDMSKNIKQSLEQTYGMIPFVKLYAKTLRSIELDLENQR
ncbi:MAG: hypothetical protein ACOCWB_06250 [Bacteroidota bacterium]